MNAPNPLKCDMCDFKTNLITVLWKHMMRNHNNEDKKTDETAEEEVVMTRIVQHVPHDGKVS